MTWRRPGDKPLSEPIIVYRRICASLGLNELNEQKYVQFAANRVTVGWWLII